MPKRMAGDGEHLKINIQRLQTDRFAAVQRARQPCDRLRRRAKHLSIGTLGKQARYAALMIVVMMRDEDGIQRQTLPLKHFEHAISTAGIDHHR